MPGVRPGHAQSISGSPTPLPQFPQLCGGEVVHRSQERWTPQPRQVPLVGTGIAEPPGGLCPHHCTPLSPAGWGYPVRSALCSVSTHSCAQSIPATFTPHDPQGPIPGEKHIPGGATTALSDPRPPGGSSGLAQPVQSSPSSAPAPGLSRCAGADAHPVFWDMAPIATGRCHRNPVGMRQPQPSSEPSSGRAGLPLAGCCPTANSPQTRFRQDRALPTRSSNPSSCAAAEAAQLPTAGHEARRETSLCLRSPCLDPSLSKTLPSPQMTQQIFSRCRQFKRRGLRCCYFRARARTAQSRNRSVVPSCGSTSVQATGRCCSGKRVLPQLWGLGAE